MSIAPISPVEEPEAATEPPASVPRGREVLFALLAAVVIAGLGAPFGWLWSKLAPHVELVQTQYGPYPLQPEPEGYWGDDGWFILMSLGMGAIVAAAAWFLLRRYRGPFLLGAVVLGSIGASVLAAWLGNKIGWSHYIDQAEHAPIDTHIFRPVKLRTGEASLVFGFLPYVRGSMLIQGLTAAAVYTGFAGFHASPTLRYDNMPPEYLGPPQPGPGAYSPPSGEYAGGYPAAGPAGFPPPPVGTPSGPGGFTPGPGGISPDYGGQARPGLPPVPSVDVPDAGAGGTEPGRHGEASASGGSGGAHPAPSVLPAGGHVAPGPEGHAPESGQPPASNGVRPAGGPDWGAMPSAAGDGPSAPYADIVWPPDGPIPGSAADGEGSADPGAGDNRQDRPA